jgi:hypothetical protein
LSHSALLGKHVRGEKDIKDLTQHGLLTKEEYKLFKMYQPRHLNACFPSASNFHVLTLEPKIGQANNLVCRRW